MSAPIITIELSEEAKALMARLPSAAGAATQALARELDLQNELTIGYAQKNKLSASSATTLGVRSGRLRQSLHRSTATISGTMITGSIGSNVKYAGVHEYGFDGDVQVSAFTRRVRSRDVRVKGKLKAAGIGSVKSFTRHMRMPARSFIGSSLQERRPLIEKALSAAVVRALEGTS